MRQNKKGPKYPDFKIYCYAAIVSGILGFLPFLYMLFPSAHATFSAISRAYGLIFFFYTIFSLRSYYRKGYPAKIRFLPSLELGFAALIMLQSIATITLYVATGSLLGELTQGWLDYGLFVVNTAFSTFEIAFSLYLLEKI